MLSYISVHNVATRSCIHAFCNLMILSKRRETCCPRSLSPPTCLSDPRVFAMESLYEYGHDHSYRDIFVCPRSSYALLHLTLFDPIHRFRLCHCSMSPYLFLSHWLPRRVLHSTRGYCGSPGTAGYCRWYCRVLWVLRVLCSTHSTRGYCRVLWVLWVLHGLK